jgi:hypothetical protein
MVSMMDESMPEPRFFIFFDSIMPPTASAATVTTRFSIIASLLRMGFDCEENIRPAPAAMPQGDRAALRTHLRLTYDNCGLHVAREPPGNCCDTVYMFSRFAPESVLAPIATFIMPA